MARSSEALGGARNMTDGMADVGGAKLWYRDTGGQGQAVVLCHPASQSGLIWKHQLAALAKAGYRAIAYSRRGYFGSDGVDPESPGTEIGDLAGLLDVLGIGAAHVVGAAAGGGVAMRMAVAHPHRLHSLVLAGTIVAPDEDDWRELYGRLGIANVKDVVSTAFIELGPSYRAVDPAGTLRFAELSDQARPRGAAGQPSGVTLTWQAMQRTDIATLLVTGEADLYAPPPLQRLLAQHLPRHELATLREIGHAPYWEAPEAFNALLLDFLGRQRAALPCGC